MLKQGRDKMIESFLPYFLNENIVYRYKKKIFFIYPFLLRNSYGLWTVWTMDYIYGLWTMVDYGLVVFPTSCPFL